MLTIPRPPKSVRSRSARSSAGSPNRAWPPSRSRVSKPRWMAARDVALHVGHEHRYTQTREALGRDHERHGLAGAGGAGDEAVAVAVLGQQIGGLLALADEYLVHGDLLSRAVAPPAGGRSSDRRPRRSGRRPCR